MSITCQKLKEQILERSDLAEILAEQDVQQHLGRCRECAQRIEYEKSLRSGFAAIRSEAPPAQLAARILAIAKQPEPVAAGKNDESIWMTISRFFGEYSLKTAALSFIIGFLAAVVLLEVPGKFKPGTEPKSQSLSRAEKKESVLPTEAAVETTNKEMLLARAGTAQAPELDSGNGFSREISEITENEAVQPQPADASSNDEEIPGAVSFSLAEEKPKMSAPVIPVPMTVSAPAKKSADRAIQSSEGLKSQISDDFSLSDEVESFDRVELKSEAMTIDPRCEELEKLIDTFASDLPSGFVKIRALAARGVIATSKISHFTPPAGMAWFLEFDNGKAKISLKREK